MVCMPIVRHKSFSPDTSIYHALRARSVLSRKIAHLVGQASTLTDEGFSGKLWRNDSSKS
ncbi:uncharacterized protein RHIMIDRAFT_275710 [Rhizopus microsporus ATCC 52813]|uniref:Uncharacterized protein n=2 Tax=Rhizopus microsporus TaxID=58291 RepID=A0A2G4T0R7_RHIZD|nr:uncharacterized protein RHIMIDRAFT_275710 [Rhizopus microsporus ATCC 52813]PHZ14613.1 hypothetical protein RHIMIDRAFT_275710 [Rhizopus microsporus ATCC 52813]